MDPISIGLGVASIGSNLIGGISQPRAQKKQSRRIREQLQQQYRLSKATQKQQEQLGRTDIANVMGLSLSNRMSSALEFTGSNAEVFAQERRNLEFSLANQLMQFDVQQMNIRNQSASVGATTKMEMFNSLLNTTSSLVGAGTEFAGGFDRQPSARSFTQDMTGQMSASFIGSDW